MLTFLLWARAWVGGHLSWWVCLGFPCGVGMDLAVLEIKLAHVVDWFQP